ncbi:hypothetical protein DV735_g5612, partial [Chaetothyriales sp. CBS 134920]
MGASKFRDLILQSAERMLPQMPDVESRSPKKSPATSKKRAATPKKPAVATKKRPATTVLQDLDQPAGESLAAGARHDPSDDVQPLVMAARKRARKGGAKLAYRPAARHIEEVSLTSSLAADEQPVEEASVNADPPCNILAKKKSQGPVESYAILDHTAAEAAEYLSAARLNVIPLR